LRTKTVHTHTHTHTDRQTDTRRWPQDLAAYGAQVNIAQTRMISDVFEGIVWCRGRTKSTRSTDSQRDTAHFMYRLHSTLLQRVFQNSPRTHSEVPEISLRCCMVETTGCEKTHPEPWRREQFFRNGILLRNFPRVFTKCVCTKKIFYDTVNKKVSYRKQIACQHSWSTL